MKEQWKFQLVYFWWWTISSY